MGVTISVARTAPRQAHGRGRAAGPAGQPRPGRRRGPPARPADDVRPHAGRQLRQHLPRGRCSPREKPARLKDLMALLKTVPEYRAAVRRDGRARGSSAAPESGRCGRISVEMTGGTEGPKTIYESYAASGVSTIVGMHISEEALENAKKAHLNVVLAGHISSDTLGLNLLLDEVEKEERLEFVGVSGFVRTRAAER
ncbi:MAG: hypothetical protein M0C28_35735 [Candidatus Moduliflexus flocculans]|nr:hypothetical protein [Candidatus Moduliflexus flocculans]